jgi:hypothetical protein
VHVIGNVFKVSPVKGDLVHAFDTARRLFECLHLASGTVGGNNEQKYGRRIYLCFPTPTYRTYIQGFWGAVLAKLFSITV